MYIILKCTEGPYKGKSKKVLLKGPKYECLLGRTITEEEFRLDQDPEISGHHLTFKWNLEKDCLQIRDEKSFNGTALNLKIIKPGVFYDVRDNSVLNVGKSRFTISIKEKLDETTEKVSTESTSSKDSCYCPGCFKDLSLMSEVGRTQHVHHCIPEKTGTSTSIIDKAQQYTHTSNYQAMSLKELSTLKQKMEDIRTALEIEYQKVQKAFYQKKAEEVLHKTTSSGKRKRESFSKVMEMIYSVPEEDDNAPQQHISKTQAKLTGSFENVKSEIVDSSDSSILSQQIDSPPVLSPSKGITRINPRRSSILVSPTKKTVPQFAISKLSVPEQSQRVQFYLGQIPPTLQDVSVSELQKKIASILNQSIEEIHATKNTLSEQIKNSSEPQPILSFLHEIALDLITELECIRPAEKRRQSMYEEKLQRPVKKPHVKSVDHITVSEDTVKRILLAIEKDKNLSYLVQSKQVIGFDRLASCIRKSMPTISSEVIQYVLDKENIAYIQCIV